MIVCSDCNQKKVHYGKGLCHNCYNKMRYHKDPKTRKRNLRQSKKWREENRERFNQYHKNYYAKTKSTLIWYHNHPDKEKVKERMKKYSKKRYKEAGL